MTVRHRFVGFVALLAFFFATGSPAFANGPSGEDFFPAWAASAPHNRPLSVLDTDSALGRRSLEPKTLTLRDLAVVHGHMCDGLVNAWVQLGVALRALFPSGVVDRTDLRVVSKNGACWADAAGWTTGARTNHGTLVLDNKVGNGFIVQRVSTGDTVRVSLKPSIVPPGFVELEDAIRATAASGKPVNPADIDRVEQMADEFSRTLLSTPPDTIVVLEKVPDYRFPAASPNPIAPRGDIINRDVPRTR